MNKLASPFVLSLCMLALCGLQAPGAYAAGSTAEEPEDGKVIVVGEASLPDQSWNVHGQATFTYQMHPTFNAPYSGENSLTPGAESARTTDATLFLGAKLWEGGEAYFNPEIDQGFGLNNTLGMAGFASAEAYKVGARDPYYRTPRAFIRQTFNLGGELVELDDQANQLAKTITSNNVVITAGKFSVVDIFDTNTYAHDPRADFLNWTGVDAGAFDYAADAWGYTYGASVEWNQDAWTWRNGYFNLSKVPNSENIDILGNQYELVTEVEKRHELFGHQGKFKVLGFANHGNMGSYSDAVALAQQTGATPQTSLVRRYAWRPGYALNLEQELSSEIGFFGRFSKNGGNEEAFEFTDVNQSTTAGLSFKGSLWNRPDDVIGVQGMINQISNQAQQYFALGGLGILIGDGALSYRPETIQEIYYSLNVVKHLDFGFDYQHVVNPAYNAARGPVNLFAFRVHAEF